MKSCFFYDGIPNVALKIARNLQTSQADMIFVKSVTQAYFLTSRNLHEKKRVNPDISGPFF